MRSGNTVKSDETLLAIVSYLQQSGPAGVTKIASEIGISKGAVQKHLNTLRNENYVRKDGSMYRLGLKFLAIGGQVRDRNELCNIVDPKLRELSEETGELVTFAVEEHGLGWFTHKYNDKYDIKAALPLGRKFYLHANAAGKAILSTFSDDKIKEVVENHGMSQYTENTITEREELIERIETVKKRGYALSIEERRYKIQAVSAPIQYSGSDIVGAISVVGPTNRLTKKKLKNEYADKILEGINEVEIIMNYSG